MSSIRSEEEGGCGGHWSGSWVSFPHAWNQVSSIEPAPCGTSIPQEFTSGRGQPSTLVCLDSKPPTLRWPPLLVLLVALGVATSASAAPRVSVRVPLLSLARSGAFTPVVVEIHSPVAWEGQVVSWFDSGMPIEETVREVSLPEGGNRRLTLAVLGTPSSTLVVRLRDSLGRVVPLPGPEGTPVAELRFEPPEGAVPDHGLRVLVLGEEPLGFTLLREVGCGPVPGHGADCDGARPVRVETLNPGELPPDWTAWTSIDVLVWRRPDPAALSPEQQIALRSWLAWGGTLVLSLADAGALWKDSPLSSLWPGVPVPLIDDLLVLGTLFDTWPREGGVLSNTPLPVSSLTPALGEDVVLRTAAGLPIILARDAGAGRILQVAFDVAALPVRDAVDRAAMWRDLLGLGLPGVPASIDGEITPVPTPTPITGPSGFRPVDPADPSCPLGPDPAAHAVYEGLDDFAALDPLPLPVVLTVGIAFVIAVGPLDWWLVRRLRRPLLAWVTLPLWSAVFSGVVTALVFAGKRGGSEARCGEDLVLDPVTAIARTELRCALWSSGRGEVDLHQDGTDGSVMAPPEDPGLPDAGPTTLSPGPAPWGRFVLEHWALRRFHSLTAAPWDRFPRFEGAGPERVLVNDTGFDLSHAWIRDRHGTISLGPLKAGARVPLPPSGSQENVAGPLVADGVDSDLLTLLLHAPEGRGSHLHGAADSPLLIGRRAEPLFPPRWSGRDVTTTTWSVLRAPLLATSEPP